MISRGLGNVKRFDARKRVTLVRLAVAAVLLLGSMLLAVDKAHMAAFSNDEAWKAITLYWESDDIVNGYVSSADKCIRDDGTKVFPDNTNARDYIREAASKWSWPRSMGPYFFIQERSTQTANLWIECANLGDNPYSGSKTVARTENFNRGSDGRLIPPGAWSRIQFNRHPYYNFNHWGCTDIRLNSSGTVDINHIVTHEMGHVATAAHSPWNGDRYNHNVMAVAPESDVACNNRLKRDDFDSVIRNQGFASEPEPSAPRGPQAMPLQNVLDYNQGTIGPHCINSQTPEAYYRYDGNYPDGPPLVNAIDGDYYFYISGCATSGSSYAYFRLYDTAPIKIRRGMQIQWWQYNHPTNDNTSQYNMSILLNFSDGTWSSDYISAMHPTNRPNVVNSWYYSAFSLDSVVGKEIVAIYAGFDNRASGKTGRWQGILENLAINYN